MKLNKLYILFAVAVMTLSSCNDALFIDPEDEIVDDNAIENVDDVEDGVIGAYASMSYVPIISWNSIFTDELFKPDSNNGQGVQVHAWSINPSTTEPDDIFTNLYLTISRTNRVLEGMAGITASNAEEQARLDRSQGELLAIRAMCHFDLLRFFAPSYTDDSALAVPYVDYVVVLQKPARNTVGEVMTGVNADLITAKSLIPSDDTVNTKITRDAITALQARIALYRNDNAAAIAFATELINAYPALANDQAGFDAIWDDATAETTGTNEVIFKLDRVAGDPHAGNRVGSIFTDTNNVIYFGPSDKLKSSYASNDLRFNKYISADGSEVEKYPGTSGAPNMNDIKVFRISEMYLIRAEAYAKTSQLPLAEDDYDAVRVARQNDFAGISFTSATDAVNKILEERFREFAFEGHRFFDLKRTATAVSRLAEDCAPVPTACNLPATDYRFTLPIPTSEIFVNNNIVQNTGYN